MPGVMFDNGRVRFRPLAEHKDALKIVAINDPNQPRQDRVPHPAPG